MKIEQILEKIEFKFDSPFAAGEIVRVHKNPNAIEMKSARLKSAVKELRGVLIGNAVYVWDANVALHGHVLDYLEIPVGGTVTPHCFVIDDDENIMPADYVTTINDLWASPMIRRMMK